MNMPIAANRAGRFVSSVALGEPVNAFVPAPLPPDPALDFSASLIGKLSDADRAIGRLDGIAMMLPEPGLFQKQPCVTARQLTTMTGLSTPTVNNVLHALELLGIVREISGNSRSRVYCYQAFLGLLGGGMQNARSAGA